MVIVTEGRPVSALPSCRKTDVVLYIYRVILAGDARNRTLWKACSLGDESRIIPMCSIPVTSIEDSDSIIIFGRQTTEEPNESDLVVNLESHKLWNCDLCHHIRPSAPA